jgi:hypothetical protein
LPGFLHFCTFAKILAKVEILKSGYPKKWPPEFYFIFSENTNLHQPTNKNPFLPSAFKLAFEANF